MEVLLIWLLGWIIWSIGYYIYKVLIEGDMYTSKRLIAWRGFTSGILSWFGIIIMIAFIIVGCLAQLNDWIEDKLR